MKAHHPPCCRSICSAQIAGEVVPGFVDFTSWVLIFFFFKWQHQESTLSSNLSLPIFYLSSPSLETTASSFFLCFVSSISFSSTPHHTFIIFSWYPLSPHLRLRLYFIFKNRKSPGHCRSAPLVCSDCFVFSGYHSNRLGNSIMLSLICFNKFKPGGSMRIGLSAYHKCIQLFCLDVFVANEEKMFEYFSLWVLDLQSFFLVFGWWWLRCVCWIRTGLDFVGNHIFIPWMVNQR